MEKIIPRTFVIGLLIFGMLIAGGVSMLSQVIDTENTQAYGNLSALNKLDEVRSQTETLKAQADLEPESSGTFGVLNGLIKGAYNALRTIWTSATTLIEIIITLGYTFSLPAWVTNGFTAIVTTLVAFMIISLVLKTST